MPVSSSEINLSPIRNRQGRQEEARFFQEEYINIAAVTYKVFCHSFLLTVAGEVITLTPETSSGGC